MRYTHTRKFDRVAMDMRWRLPKNTNITADGRALVESDPGLDKETMKKLWDTDRSKLSPKEVSFVCTTSTKKIVETIFDAHRGLSLVHLNQCIADCKDGPLAEAVAMYADERRIPFLFAAICVKSLMKTQKTELTYFKTGRNGAHQYRWTPVPRYAPLNAPSTPPQNF